MMATMDAVEYAHWMAFYRIDPWGGYRSDLQSASIATTIANVHRSADSSPWQLSDFMHYQQFPESEPDHEYVSGQWKSYFSALKRSRQDV